MATHNYNPAAFRRDDLFAKSIIDAAGEKLRVWEWHDRPKNGYLITESGKEKFFEIGDRGKVILREANPAVSVEQYRLAQAVLSGTARDARMPVSMAALAYNPIPVGSTGTELFKKIADTQLARVRKMYGDKLEVKSCLKVCSAVERRDGVLVLTVPQPTSVLKLRAFIHECQHAILGHSKHSYDDTFPLSTMEYEAEQATLRILESNGVNISPQMRKSSELYVAAAVGYDVKHKVKPDQRAVRYAGDYLGDKKLADALDRVQKSEATKNPCGCGMELGGLAMNPDIHPGDFVKIIRGNERFWVRYMGKGGGKAHGVVDNELLNTSIHGLSRGSKVSFKPSEVIDVVRENPAVSAEQYRLAQAVLSGTARDTHMPVDVAREIVGRTPAKLRSEYNRNPVYGMDLDLETSMAPAWMYYDSKAARDAAARMYEGRGKKVVLGHSMFGFGEGGGKKWRLRGLDHRGNPQPAADDMYASFHGEESDETIEIEGEEHYHSYVAALGELVELKVKLVSGGRAVIGFESGEDESDTVDNPFWSSARSTASKISGSVLSGLKRAAASRKEQARWIPYTTTDSEVRAQAKAGYLEAHDVSAKVEKRKVGGILSRKYKFDVMVDREQLREMFKRSAGEKRASRGSRADGSKPAGAYKGYQIREVEGGFAVPKLDPEGVFTSKADAKEFIDYSKLGAKVKNPGPFHEAGKLLGRGTRMAQKPMDQFLGAAGKVGGYLDDELGRAINPGPNSHSTGPVYLTSNEDGTQLYITGGDQSLDLPGLGITGPAADKELVTVGQVTNIVYHAHKIFDGKREEYDYTHKFSEDTHGPLPILTYDRINQQLKLSGGVYKIERPLVGTSPGIED
jgi:hypothetical protein